MRVLLAILMYGLPLVSVSSAAVIKSFDQVRVEPPKFPESIATRVIASSFACVVVAVVPVLRVFVAVSRYASFSAETDLFFSIY